MNKCVAGPVARWRKKPELLAPAGDFEMARIAVRNGADAVYFGARAFNARARATNFTDREWREAIDYLHVHNCHAYLTLNTLVTDRELDEALRLAEQAYLAGIDAFIVQDVGLARAILRRMPDIHLFASTQMSLGNEPGLLAAQQAGLRRVILPRERTAAEVRQLAAYAQAIGMETEVFVHGALCVSFSGQCLMSALQGGRSANRGACAQPCRLPYELVNARGAVVEAGAQPRISLKDQSLYPHVAALAAAGVTSLKIEGRLRSPAYVGAVVSAYRRALDDTPAKEDPLQLLQAFNRGGAFTDAFWSDRRRPEMLSGPWTGSHGVAVGTVAAVRPQTGWLQIQSEDVATQEPPLQRKDVLSVRRGQAEIASAPIGPMERYGGGWRVKGFHPDVLHRIEVGDRLYKMTDEALERRVRANDLRKTAVSFALRADADRVYLHAHAAHARVSIQQTVPADSGQRAPLTATRVRQQLGKTGSTAFVATHIQVEEPLPALTVAAVNALRRDALAALSQQLATSYHRNPDRLAAPSPLPAEEQAGIVAPHAIATQQISVFYWQWPKDNQAAVDADVYFLPVHALLPQTAGAARLHQLKQAQPGCQIYAVLPPGAICCQPLQSLLATLQALRAEGLTGWASHSLDIHTAPMDGRRALEPGGNVTNAQALTYHAAAGLARVALSHEIEPQDAATILTAAQGSCVTEITLYGRLGAMHTYTCPVTANACSNPLQSGACLHDSFALVDARQRRFPLLCHPGTCTTDILSAEPVTRTDLLRHLLRSLDSGEMPAISTPVAWRLYFYDEPATARTELVAALRAVVSPREVMPAWQEDAIWSRWEASLRSAGNIDKN